MFGDRDECPAVAFFHWELRPGGYTVESREVSQAFAQMCGESHDNHCTLLPSARASLSHRLRYWAMTVSPAATA